MEQVREVMTVNPEIEGESSWICSTSEQMGFPLRSEFNKRNKVRPEVRNNAVTSVLLKPHIFKRQSSQISFETQKGNSMMISSKMRLKC